MVQDKTALKALITSTITTNNNKEISGADVNTVVTDIVDSAVWYNEAQSKNNVRVATTAAGTLATSFEHGDTIDGVVLETGNRILIKDQASATENGCYTVNASGAPTRATDFDTADEVILGSEFFVTEGTANGGKKFRLTAPTGTITLGSSNLTFTVEGSTFDISGLSSFSGTVDTTNDYLAVYDNSGATNLKIAASRVVPLYGTFTPAIAFGGGATGATYVTQTGTYIETVLNDGKYKIEYNIFLNISAKGSSTGNMTITGLPRTCITGQNFVSSILPLDVTTGASDSFPISGNSVMGMVVTASATIALYNNEEDTPLTHAEVDTAGVGNLSIRLSGFYISG